MLDIFGESKFKITTSHDDLLSNTYGERTSIVTAILQAGGTEFAMEMPLRVYCWNQVLSIEWNSGAVLSSTFVVATENYEKTINLSDLWTVTTDLNECFEEEIIIYLEAEKTTLAYNSDILTFNHTFNGTGGRTTVEVTVDTRYSRSLTLYFEMK
mmetsp:Transcript_17631/g.27283  ORF Transcript_17631/g.27283 Transcript_17631/m.27283 type:complete len:155 (+) Transcript_17631:103-567(+)